MHHVRRGSWLAYDPIALRGGSQGTTHRITAPQAHPQPYRSKENIKEHAQENTGIDPPQDLPRHHPKAIDLRETPGPDKPQAHAQPTQDQAPQARGLTTPHHGPE